MIYCVYSSAVARIFLREFGICRAEKQGVIFLCRIYGIKQLGGFFAKNVIIKVKKMLNCLKI